MGGACGTQRIEEKYVQSFGGKTLKEIDHLEDICRDGRIILKCVLKKKEDTVWTLFTFSRYRAVVGPCRHSNELLGSVKCGKYFD